MSGSKCNKCNLAVPVDGDFVFCKGCDSALHYDSCSGLKKTTYQGKSQEDKNNWRCKPCRDLKKTGQTTPSGDSQTFSFSDAGLDAIEDLKREFRESFKNFTCEITASNEKLLLKVNELEGTVTSLQKQVKEKDIVIHNLSHQLYHLDQYGRNKNLEIENVEYKKEESVEEIVLNLAKELSIDIVRSDIDAAHRLPSKDSKRPPKILVQFVARKKRDSFLAKRKAGITSDRLVPGGNQKLKIYINENLTLFNKELHYQVKLRAKENNFKFVWVKQGKVFVRKDESNKSIKILSIEDIDKYII